MFLTSIENEGLSSDRRSLHSPARQIEYPARLKHDFFFFSFFPGYLCLPESGFKARDPIKSRSGTLPTGISSEQPQSMPNIPHPSCTASTQLPLNCISWQQLQPTSINSLTLSLSTFFFTRRLSSSTDMCLVRGVLLVPIRAHHSIILWISA